jgi:hypothetical protein
LSDEFSGELESKLRRVRRSVIQTVRRVRTAGSAASARELRRMRRELDTQRQWVTGAVGGSAVVLLMALCLRRG